MRRILHHLSLHRLLQQAHSDTTMFKSVLLVLLMSAGALRADAEGGTFSVTDPVNGSPLQCDRCPPGTYLRDGCTSTRATMCAPCPKGSFTELWNYIPKCLRCGVCGHNQVVKTACAPTADCKCECKKGFYYKESYDMCVAHSKCPAGEGVLSEGSAENDTVCQPCPSGSFSDTVSARDTCSAHRSCGDAPELKLLLRGSAWHDSVCGSAETLQSTDGAEYLREILPAFFLHQNMNVRRLRRILHKLPSNKFTTSGPYLSVSARIDDWVASATASQIRQLPDILTRSGVDHAGERLQSKLQRIESTLSELHSLGKQVDMLSSRK